VAILNGYQFIMAVLGHADDHQQPEPVIQAHVAVYAIGPSIDVALLAQAPALPVLVFIKPPCLEPGDSVRRQPVGLLADLGAQS
jgi:hypothetical protein